MEVSHNQIDSERRTTGLRSNLPDDDFVQLVPDASTPIPYSSQRGPVQSLCDKFVWSLVFYVVFFVMQNKKQQNVNYRDLTEIFPMICDRGIVLANQSERMEERSFIDLMKDKEVTKKRFPIYSHKSRQNHDDLNTDNDRKQSDSKVALSDRMLMMRSIVMFVFLTHTNKKVRIFLSARIS